MDRVDNYTGSDKIKDIKIRVHNAKSLQYGKMDTGTLIDHLTIINLLISDTMKTEEELRINLSSHTKELLELKKLIRIKVIENANGLNLENKPLLFNKSELQSIYTSMMFQINMLTEMNGRLKLNKDQLGVIIYQTEKLHRVTDKISELFKKKGW